jgi:formate dehydrogenase major subunit
MLNENMMQMKYVTTTCPYCGTGCGLNLIVNDSEVVGVAPYHRSPVGNGKLCARGIYAAKAISEFRLETPLISGSPAEWEKAVAEVMKLKNYSGEDLAVYTSSRLTNEANYCIMRFAKEILKAGTIGTLTPGIVARGNMHLNDLKEADVALVFGDCMKKLPLTGNKLFNMQQKGGKILYAGEESYTAIQADAKCLADEEGNISLTDEFINLLKEAKNPVVVYSIAGKYAELAEETAKTCNAKTAVLYETNNGRGAAEIGYIPSLDTLKTAEKVPKAMLIFAETPMGDDDIYAELGDILAKVEHLVVIASNESSLTNIANVVLPTTTFSESDGTFTNWEGRVQKVSSAVPAPEGVKSPCEVIAELSGNAISYKDNEAIFADIKTNVPAFNTVSLEDALKAEGTFIKEV